jgi:hypothetical protein
MVIAAVGVTVFTDRVPPIVTALPLSVIMESTIELLPLNLAIAPDVPPTVVTPPPVPAQLPTVVQMSYVPAAAVSRRYVTLAVGVWNDIVVTFAPLVAEMVLLALPCTRKLCVVAPTVSDEVGVNVFAVSAPVTVAPPFKLARPETPSVPVKLVELLIV